jgi:hypothetical protein
MRMLFRYLARTMMKLASDEEVVQDFVIAVLLSSAARKFLPGVLPCVPI